MEKLYCKKSKFFVRGKTSKLLSETNSSTVFYADISATGYWLS